MKKYASRTLRLISLFYLGFPITFPVLLALWFEIPGPRIISLFLSPIYWFVVGLAVVSGYGLWEMKRWAWYVFLSANLFLVYESAFVSATFGNGHHSALGFLLIVSLIFACMVRVGNEMRVPYFLPNIRWWESDPSRKLSIAAQIKREDRSIEGEILDLALMGCFLKTPEDFKEDEVLLVRFQLFGHEIQAKGQVAWRAASTVTHPKGVGIKFSAIEKGNRRKLRIAVQKIKKMHIFSPASLAAPLIPEKSPRHAKV